MEESGVEDEEMTLLSNDFDKIFCFIGGQILNLKVQIYKASALNRKSLRTNLLLNPRKILLNVDINAGDVLVVASNSPRNDSCLVVKAWIAWNRAD
jgi:uncharacterized phosphosugar-binding protein